MNATTVAKPDPRTLRFCVIAARWNTDHVDRLVDAARVSLAGLGVPAENVDVRRVPGSFELPVAALWAARSGAFDAVLAFGVVIRGGTEHFRLVADASSQGLLRVSLDTGVPVLNGVLACENADQATARTGGEMGNRGSEVALAAFEMASQHRVHAS